MRLPSTLIRLMTTASLAAVTPTHAEDAGPSHWPGFRGPDAGGVAAGQVTPTHWSVENHQHIKWETPINGLGHSCPVVWGDRIFVTTAVREEGLAELRAGIYGDIAPVDNNTSVSWLLYCLDRITGRILWQRTAHAGVPIIKRHPKSSHANPTPATDGTHVVAFFGSEGIYCYDFAGQLLWRKNLGVLDSGYFRVPTAQWGFASSPVIHDGRLVLQCDVQDGGFLAVLDVHDGNEIWRTPRKDVPTWSTPAVYVGRGAAQIIVNGFRHIGAYDLDSGNPRWQLTGGGDIPVPTPIVAHDLIYITNAHGGLAPIYAVRTEAEGDVTPGSKGAKAFLAWYEDRGGNYMQTPIVIGTWLYLCTDGGVVSCRDATSGRLHYRQRLPERSGYTASPVATTEHIYFTSENGHVVVLATGPTYQWIATNDLGEPCLATPAIANGEIIFRTRHHVIAVGRDETGR